MATALSPPTRWDYLPRPQSQPTPDRDRSTYTPRGMRNSPSDHTETETPPPPTIINSILDSFTPSPAHGDQNYRFDDSPLRPYSADDGVRGRHSLIRSSTSPAIGGDQHNDGTVVSKEEREGNNYAKRLFLPFTSRSASGLSNSSLLATSSFTAPDSSLHLRSPSNTSQQSYASGGVIKERPSTARNKLSAESWVKSQEGSTPAKQTRETRNAGSKRPTQLKAEVSNYDAIHSKKSPFGDIIAQAARSAPASPKGRLFLTENGSREEMEAIPIRVEDPEEPSLTVQAATSDYTAPTLRVQKPSGQPPSVRSSIVDSIPTRTSSLRQSSVSPNPGKKKEKKKSKKSTANPKSETFSSVFRRSAKPIPDSKWDDLGEDDETVKRIRELRERRQSRMMESRNSSMSIERSRSPAMRDRFKPDLAVDSPLSENAPDGYLHPHAASSQNMIETPTRPSGLSNSLATPRSNDARSNPRTNVSPSEDGASLNIRETNSPTVPQLSLDYSYNQAITSLHVAQISNGDAEKAKGTPGRDSQDPVQPRRASPTTVPAMDSPMQRLRSKSFRRPFGRTEAQSSGSVPRLSSTAEREGTQRTGHPKVSAETNSALYGDTVEVAVNKYLQSPRFYRRIKHPVTGRVVTFSEVGDPEGAAVFVCIGMGLTRYIAGFFDELAHTLRLRLITVDRPGIGASEPFPPQDRRGPLGWPEDVLAICKSLNISKFSVLAHSAGAVYALATALVIPHMIEGRVHLLAPWIPPSQLELTSRSSTSAAPAAALPRSQRFLRALPTPILKAANASFMSSASASLKPTSQTRRSSVSRSEDPRILSTPSPTRNMRERPPSRSSVSTGHRRQESLLSMDQCMPDMGADSFPAPGTEDDQARRPSTRNAALEFSSTTLPNGVSATSVTERTAADHQEEERLARFTRQLTQKTWELATKDSNPATDLIICLESHRDIGFRYVDVHRDVVITHGSEDKRVPVGNVRWLAEQMNRRPGTARQRGSVNGSTASPSCELRVLNGEGHGLMASASVMGDVLEEIAGYWTGHVNGGMNIPGDGEAF